jgi:hypothetical protein
MKLKVKWPATETNWWFSPEMNDRTTISKIVHIYDARTVIINVYNARQCNQRKNRKIIKYHGFARAS